MEIYLYAGILAKMVTNTHIEGKWMWQEALGPLGNTGRLHNGTAQPPKCHLGTGHVTNPWELLHKLSYALI